MEYVVSREGLGYSIKSKLEGTHSDNLKSIIRQHWKEKLESLDKMKSKALAAELEAHIANMNAIIDPMDYEAFCIPNIIQHSKHMQREDFSNYLKLLESMAIGYSNHLGSDLTNLVLIGVTSKGRNVSSAERYLNLLLNELNNKSNYYQFHIDKRGKRVQNLSARLAAHESSLLRIFKRRRISLLNRKIRAKGKEIATLRSRLEKCNSVIARINAVRARRSAQLPPPKPSPA